MGQERDYSRLETTAFSRERMSALSVLVAGAGALGNEVIKNLALLGVGNLAVLDRDRIEASNLTRSVLFCTDDIRHHIDSGTPKAVFAACRVREINPDVHVTPYVGEVGDLGTGTLRRVDLVFSCLDNEMARLELSWMCTRLNKPLVDGGLGVLNTSSGLVSLFPGRDGPCYACRKGVERRRTLLVDLQGREDPCGARERVAREAAAVPTTPVMASIVGAFQVEAGIRLLSGDSRADVLRGVSYRVTLHPRATLDTTWFERSPRCPLHEAESMIDHVEERAVRRSDAWTAGELLHETGCDRAFLHFDWPLTVRAECRGCGHRWEPMLRRARFRRESCPACSSPDIVETEVLTGLDAESPWAGRPLAALGLPPAHIHEIVLGSTADAPHRHVEVTGDLEARAGGIQA